MTTFSTSATSVASTAQAARLLSERRRTGTQGERLPESCRPGDLAAALAIQTLVTAELGATVRAWKCGTPSEGKLVVAPIYTITRAEQGHCQVWNRAGQVRVEPELAFVLAQDLPARTEPYSDEEIDAAIGSVHLALELIDSRYTSPGSVSFAENLADGLLNQGLFIGPQLSAMELSEIHAGTREHVCIDVHTEAQATKQFKGRHPDADPRIPLYWLVNYLRSQGQALLAGQAVITGSYAGSFEVPIDATTKIVFGELGLLQVRFSAR
ncbi:hypothetical protein [Undibacterium sp. RuTC16W]|uniref:hypothetical protein n=1 Tax=Undibacterium sp. RuTC16W TaxID=3413048 RepID=UPI003BF0A1E3